MTQLTEKSLRHTQQAETLFNTLFLFPSRSDDYSILRSQYIHNRNTTPVTKDTIQVLTRFSDLIEEKGGLLSVFEEAQIPQEEQGPYAYRVAELGLSYLPTSKSSGEKPSSETISRDRMAKKLLEPALVWQLHNLSYNSRLEPDLPVVRAIRECAYQDERVGPYLQDVFSVLHNGVRKNILKTLEEKEFVTREEQAQRMLNTFGASLIMDEIFSSTDTSKAVLAELFYPSQNGPKPLKKDYDPRWYFILNMYEILQKLIRTEDNGGVTMLDQHFETFVDFAVSQVVLGNNTDDRYDALEQLALYSGELMMPDRWKGIVTSKINDRVTHIKRKAKKFGIDAGMFPCYGYRSIKSELDRNSSLMQRNTFIKKLINP